MLNGGWWRYVRAGRELEIVHKAVSKGNNQRIKTFGKAKSYNSIRWQSFCLSLVSRLGLCIYDISNKRTWLNKTPLPPRWRHEVFSMSLQKKIKEKAFFLFQQQKRTEIKWMNDKDIFLLSNIKGRRKDVVSELFCMRRFTSSIEKIRNHKDIFSSSCCSAKEVERKLRVLYLS